MKVRSVDAELAEALRWHLEPFRRPREEPGAIDAMIYVRPEDEDLEPKPLSYFRGPERMFGDPEPRRIFEYAVWDIQYAALLFIRSYLALHAGVVASEGGGVLLPGPQESGKSTLTAALLSKGFPYLSDEVAPLDPVTGRVFPYPRLLHLSAEAVEGFPGLAERLEDGGLRSRGRFERTIRPEDLDAGVAGPSPIRAIVLLTRDRHGAPRLVELPRSETVEKMAENALNLHLYGARGVVFLSRVVANAETYVLEGGTAMERAELLTERFVGPS